jgi:hypothetical protein
LSKLRDFLRNIEVIMKTTAFLAAGVLALFASIALAQTGPADTPDSQSLSKGAKDANPEDTGGGSTANPTAEPKSGTLSDKGKEGTDAGTNPATDPTGTPSSSDLGSKKTNN